MAERLILISPKDLNDESDIDLVGARGDRARRVWLPSPGFGPWLRRRRDDANLSLRKASDRMGISHTYLAQIEAGDGPSPLGLDLYERIADVYALDDREVLHQAGCRFAVVEQVAEALRDLEETRFERLMLHPRLCPTGFTRKGLALFPEAVRHHVIELAQAVDHNARKGGPSIFDILDGVEDDS